MTDTYADDPELKRVRRAAVAFQAISIQGERWIVNSTLPVHELSGLLGMMTMLIGVMILHMLILAVIMVFFLRNRFLAESQQKRSRI